MIELYKKKKVEDISQFLNKQASNLAIKGIIDLSEYLYRKEKINDYNSIIEFLKANYSNYDKVNLAIGKYFLRNGRIKDALNNFKTELKKNPDDYWSNRLQNTYSTENKCKEKFKLKGYENATSVILYGNFNELRGYDNVCKLENGVWGTCVNSNEKNYFIDGKWVELPKNLEFEKLSNGFKALVKTN